MTRLYAALVQQLWLRRARQPQQHLAALHAAQKQEHRRCLGCEAFELCSHLLDAVHLRWE